MQFKKWLEVFDNIGAKTNDVTWVDSETGKLLPGPDCAHHCMAQFKAGIHDYRIYIDLDADNTVLVDFLTVKHGVFLTKEGIPVTILTMVMTALKQYVATCHVRAFGFTAESKKRDTVFRKIVAKAFPDYEQQPDGLFVKRQFNSPIVPSQS